MYSLMMIVVFFALVVIGVLTALAIVLYLKHKREAIRSEQPSDQIDAQFKN